MAGPEQPIQDTINVVEWTPTLGSGNTITPNTQNAPAEDDASSPTNGGGRASGYFARGGKLRPFRLLKEDVVNLKSRYLSDWQVFNQQVVASAVYIFFTNLLPGITFASDLYTLTGKSWGTIEVVFSTGLCGLIFSLLVEFLPVMAWSLIHAGWMHYLLAIFNAHDWTMQYVTHFSADIFSLLNSVIYFHKAAMELKRTHARVSLAAFLYAVLGAVGTCLLAILLSTANSWKPMLHRYVRLGLTEYAAAISIIIWIGIPYIGELASLDHIRLEVQTSFRPTNPDRTTFFVRFWEIPIEWVFLSMIPGAIVTVLFYFDHEISSIICTVERYGTKKPGGYAWDVALLGTTTILCGILGIPPANGLLPQAPLHSESLMHYVIESPPAEEGEQPDSPRPVARTYEQRYSHFIQASLILIFVSPPLQKLLGLTQTSVLAGLFLFMGYQSLTVNPILGRVVKLLTPPSDLPALPDNVSWFGIHMYTITQIIMTGIVFGVTLTVAAPAFPLIIIALVPVRLSLINRVWSRETLRLVDGWACREGKPEDSDSETMQVQGSGDEEKASERRENPRLSLAVAQVCTCQIRINLCFICMLLDNGCSVLIADLKLRPEAQQLLKQYPFPGVDGKAGVLFGETDVTSWAQLTAAWKKALEKFTTVDIVVPGAGLFEPQWSSFWEPPKTESNEDSVSRDDANAEPGHYAVLDVNLVSPIRLSQLAIGHWTKTKQKGCLVHVGSMAGYLAGIATPLYFASKHGLHGFVRALGGLRDELGIRVGCIAPGAVETPLWHEDPTKAVMLDEDTVLIDPLEVARGMWQLVVNPEYGNGTILEVTKGETRVVPLFNASVPTGEGIMVPGYDASKDALYAKLKKEGLNV
ncbi:anion transport [Fusarium agapanthi]|uniref:Anion transport n=1 Tax=Fusarium agapanthi TaxID=1803897 RepID=A0A9P5B8F5_9HYPO|nr:anion transport [Fusarium agapanthi]